MKTCRVEVQPGQVWKHWKGAMYRIIAVAIDEETHGVRIVYQGEVDGKVWDRSLESWRRAVGKPPHEHDRFVFVRTDRS